MTSRCEVNARNSFANGGLKLITCCVHATTLVTQTSTRTPMGTGEERVGTSSPGLAREHRRMDFRNPRTALRLMQELEGQHGLTNDEFEQLHHFAKRNLESFRRWCDGTAAK